VRASTLNNVSPRGEIALLLEPRDLIEPDWNISRFRTESENFGTQQRFDSKQQSQNLFQCSNVPTIFKHTQAKSFLSLKRRRGVHNFAFFTSKANHSKITGTLEHLPFLLLLLLYNNIYIIYKTMTYLPSNKLVTVFQCSTDPFFDPSKLEPSGTPRSI
jgi:hypothetical protein